MLILQRNKHQSINIYSPSGDKIKITFSRKKDDKRIYLGIDAPDEYNIVRTEADKNEPKEVRDRERNISIREGTKRTNRTSNRKIRPQAPPRAFTPKALYHQNSDYHPDIFLEDPPKKEVKITKKFKASKIELPKVDRKKLTLNKGEKL